LIVRLAGWVFVGGELRRSSVFFSEWRLLCPESEGFFSPPTSPFFPSPTNPLLLPPPSFFLPRLPSRHSPFPLSSSPRCRPLSSEQHQLLPSLESSSEISFFRSKDAFQFCFFHTQYHSLSPDGFLDLFLSGKSPVFSILRARSVDEPIALGLTSSDDRAGRRRRAPRLVMPLQYDSFWNCRHVGLAVSILHVDASRLAFFPPGLFFWR